MSGNDFVKMELQSTVSFREIDIDKMLEHTTLDEFLRGLYVSAISEPAQGKLTQQQKLMNMLMGKDAKIEEDEEKKSQPELIFDDKKSVIDQFRGENLRKQALQNLKERRQKQKQSQIFNLKDQGKQGEDEDDEDEEETKTQK